MTTRKLAGSVKDMDDGHKWALLPLEMLVFTAFGQAAHVLTSIPPWVGAGVSALFVGVLLRLLDPVLRELGEKLRDRKK